MIFTLPSVGVADIVMSISVCVFVCLSVRVIYDHVSVLI